MIGLLKTIRRVLYPRPRFSILQPQKVIALCHTCDRQHDIHFDPVAGVGQAFADWLTKHPGHAIEFRDPWRSRRQREANGHSSPWMKYLHNADVKPAYASSAAYTCTLGALATSSTLVAGRETTAVSNTTNLYDDYLVGGRITVGTTPTASTSIEVWAYGSTNDTPTYPDVFDGTDSAETATSVGIKHGSLSPIASLLCDATTSDRVYWFHPVSLCLCMNVKTPPKNHGLWVTHNTAVNLNATDGNHVLNLTGVYATVV